MARGRGEVIASDDATRRARHDMNVAGQKQRFIDIMGDAKNSGAVLLPDPQ